MSSKLSATTRELIQRLLTQGVNPDHLVELAAAAFADGVTSAAAMLKVSGLTPSSKLVH